MTANPNKDVVYVTNDAKSDFFFKIDGKVRGPNESLITEMKSRGAKKFVLQNIDTFLHHAKTHLNAEIDDATISELTNASPLNKGSTNVLNIIKKQSLQNAARALLTSSVSDRYYDNLEKTYMRNIELIGSYKAQLNDLNNTPTNNLNETELTRLEKQKEELLSKIEFSKTIIKVIEISSKNKDFSNLISPEDTDNPEEGS